MQQSATRKRRRTTPLPQVVATKIETCLPVVLLQVLTLLILRDVSAVSLKTSQFSRFQHRVVYNHVGLQPLGATQVEVLDEEDTRTPSSTSKTSVSLCRPLTREGRRSLWETDDDDVVSKRLLPPWLSKPTELVTDETVQTKMKELEYSLIEHGFPANDVADVVRGILSVTSGSSSKIVGCIDFCRLIVELEEPHSNSHGFLFATKEVLLASILHFSECVTSREQDVYGRVSSALGSPLVVGPPHHEEEDAKEHDHHDEISSLLDPVLDNFPVDMRLCQTPSALASSSEGPNIFTDEVRRLARGAARIKRSEILADVVLSKSRGLTKSEYADVRDMLLALMEDWRALAIRCVASLYRLDGILQGVDNGPGKYIHRSPEAIRAARESMRVYVNLAQRLGMHRLKSQLESRAFRILYPKQFSAVSTLFRQSGKSMGAVSAYLTSQVKEVLYRDESLMAQLEDLQISSRVKEPYSFWRKLLKKRLDRSQNHKSMLSPSSEISVIEVLDGIAMRVIIKARKQTADESDEDTRSRERLLCYYIQHLLGSMWPARDKSRIKDYIQNPKSNGYQSLHFTSSIAFGDQEYPFEVQVRSDEMHRVAEHGVAAHWSYKTGGKSTVSSLPLAATEVEKGRLLPSSKSEEYDNDTVGSSALTTMVQSTDAGDSAYINALVTARNSLVLSTVYVFLAGASSTSLEEGELMSLPAGALVSDILRQLEMKYSLQTNDGDFAIWRNGKPACLDEFLKNGDVVLLCRK